MIKSSIEIRMISMPDSLVKAGDCLGIGYS